MTQERGYAEQEGWRAWQWAVPAILLMAVTGVAAVTLPGWAVDRTMVRSQQTQAEFWADRITASLVAGDDTFRNQTVTPQDAVLLEAIALTSNVFRLNLIGNDGRVFWGLHPEEVGRFHLASDHGDGLVQGLTSVVIGSARALEIAGRHEDHADDLAAGAGMLGDEGADRIVAEIDVAVFDDGEKVGRIEYFADLTEERAIYVARLKEIIGFVLLAAAVAGGLILVMIVRANRARMRALAARAAREQALLSDQLQLGREVRLLGDLNGWLQTSRSLDELFEMSARFLTHLMPDCEGSMYVYSNSRDVLDGCASWNGGAHKAQIHPEECWGLRRGRTYAFGGGEVDFTCAHAEPHDGRPYLCIPVLAHGETVGLMHLRAHDGVTAERFDEGRRLAQMCAEQISLAIANVRMRDQLQDQSVRDPLTGLYNRRHMIESLRRALGTLGRGTATVAVVAIDVDHFKRFNDNHGHDAGDMVLRAVAAALTRLCDRDEVACRIGGEEMMVLLPGAAVPEALAKAEEIRAAVEMVTVRYGEKNLPRVTISLGVALAPMNGALPQDLMRAADDALYAAKARGRNQVVLAGTEGTDLSEWSAALNPPEVLRPGEAAGGEAMEGATVQAVAA